VAQSTFSVSLVVYRGSKQLLKTSIDRPVIKIGRDPKCHVCVDDPALAKVHAILQTGSGEELALTDLGHEPRTQVNGEKVEKATVEVGDEIRIGDISIVIQDITAVSQPSPVTMSAAAEPTAAPPKKAAPAVVVAAAPAKPAAAAPGKTSAAAARAAAMTEKILSEDPFEVMSFGQIEVDEAFGPASKRFGRPLSDARYVMTKCAPDVNPEEVELANVLTVEVMVLWQDTVLHVKHLTPPRSFYVGEPRGDEPPCDFTLPEETLGLSRLPVVQVNGGVIQLVIPPGATGTLQLQGGKAASFEELLKAGKLDPCAAVEGGHQVALAFGSKARIELKNFAFMIGVVSAGRRYAWNPFRGSGWATSFIVLSALVHVGLLTSMVVFLPPLGLTQTEDVNKDQAVLMNQYLKASAERERALVKELEATGELSTQPEGGTGEAAKGDSGQMGTPNSSAIGKMYAIKKTSDTPSLQDAKANELKEATNAYMIGLLREMARSDPNAPAAAWGTVSSGVDEESARGLMWGNSIGDAAGTGGLGLSGIGEGGGDKGFLIGLGRNIGTIGHGDGSDGPGQGIGPGKGPGKLQESTHVAKAPQVRFEGTTVNGGKIAPEVIQRIVRQNFGRFRACYESGLRNNPSLAGRVAVRFIIGRDGAVGMASGDNGLPDSAVTSCVVRAFYGLSFPPPEGGVVTVVYPIVFTPGG
jgi:hypothetical protein